MNSWYLEQEEQDGRFVSVPRYRNDESDFDTREDREFAKDDTPDYRH